MILVIADDLAGAAELAGAARNLGLGAELQTAFHGETEADVVCLDTDTRSCSPEEAARRVLEATRRAVTCHPAWIYKKCDSVLRGQVLAEVRAVMEASGHSRALLIPANPRRGRLIRDGRYFVGGQRLDETAFARDPEHPRWTAEVLQLLTADYLNVSAERGPLYSLRPREQLPSGGVIVPDARSSIDLAYRAAQVDDTTLPAGGVEFFEALLLEKGSTRECRGSLALRPAGGGSEADLAARRPEDAASHPASTLFICGSAAAWSGSRRRQCVELGIPVLPMPAALFAADCDDAALEAWAEGIRRTAAANRCVTASIGDAAMPAVSSPELAWRLAMAVRRMLQRQPVARLCAEGGATAAALLRAADWTRLTVCQPCAPGVGALLPLGVTAPVLFIKPGSYEWPEEVWESARDA